MTAALEGSEWSAARPGRNLPPGKTRYPFYRSLREPRGRSGRAENLVPAGIRSRTVQPVVSRYTDWATGSTKNPKYQQESLMDYEFFFQQETRLNHACSPPPPLLRSHSKPMRSSWFVNKYCTHHVVPFFRRVRKIAKNDYQVRLVRLSISHWADFHENLFGDFSKIHRRKWKFR